MERSHVEMVFNGKNTRISWNKTSTRIKCPNKAKQTIDNHTKRDETDVTLLSFYSFLFDFVLRLSDIFPAIHLTYMHC